VSVREKLEVREIPPCWRGRENGRGEHGARRTIAMVLTWAQSNLKCGEWTKGDGGKGKKKD